MARSPSILKRGSLRLPIRRVLAIDPGTRCIKLLLAETSFGRLRVLKEELIDLQTEGLVSPDEIKAYLQNTMSAWGRPPLALVLPQHLTISQLIDLPQAPEKEVEKLIQDETLKLGGVSESRIVYDFVRTESPVKNRQRFWVTLSQEGDIRERMLRLGIEQEDVCEITTTANALMVAYLNSYPQNTRAVLVHAGAQTTVVVILMDGQVAFATSFQMGGDFFTRAIARLRNCSEESADALKRQGDILNGPEALPEFVGIVEGWVGELKRQLNEFLEHHPAMATEVRNLEIVVSGGTFDQAGFIEFLQVRAGLNVQPWTHITEPRTAGAGKGFEVVFGAALQALGSTPLRVSLLPEDYRAAWNKRQTLQKVEFLSFVMALVCTLALAIGTWHKLTLVKHKSALLAKVQAGQEAVDANDSLTTELLGEYETFRPVFAGQQNTVDTLKTLALLQQSRSNRSFWNVLVADQSSYFSQPTNINSTNKPAKTNGSAAIFSLSSTNIFPAKPGLMVEMCIPEDAETSRRILGQFVHDLKQQTFFSKVDLLSDDLRRSLADPKVVLSDRDYVLALDFATSDFQSAPRPKKSPRQNPKRPAREAEEKPLQVSP